MGSFLGQYGGTIAIGVIVAAAVIAAAAKLWRDRKKGKNSCGCGCDHCPSQGVCHTK